MAFTETMKVSFEPMQMQSIKAQAQALGLKPAVFVRLKTLESLDRQRWQKQGKHQHLFAMTNDGQACACGILYADYLKGD